MFHPMFLGCEQIRLLRFAHIFAAASLCLARASAMGFFTWLAERAESINSLLCVGLDPHASELPANTAEAALAFSKRLIDATAPYAAAFKPNAAFFEAFGAEGVDALRQAIAHVPEDIPVLLDAKRGDIGTTAAAYATAAFDALGAHAITVNAYMGADTVQPFAEEAGHGVFVLCKTSNPSSSELQALDVGGGQALFERVAVLATEWNTRDNIGLVVGATDVDALRRARAAAPDLWILAPGIGAQGGDLDAAIAAGVDGRGAGLLVPISRGISRATDPADAARDFRDKINAARRRSSAAATASASAADARGPPACAADADGGGVAVYQADFINFALSKQVLRFGSFTLKSGRQSPYFFNAGLFASGAALSRLAAAYAAAVAARRPTLEFDAVFGPAYKGIALGAAVAIALSAPETAGGLGRDVGFAYNRKEVKDHGEGGRMVGTALAGKRVLVVDDVITGGTAIREAFGMLEAAGATPVGVAIALDRQERTGAEGGGGLSAVQQVERDYGVPVISVIGMQQIMAFLTGAGQDAEVLAAVRAYREQYGI